MDKIFYIIGLAAVGVILVILFFQVYRIVLVPFFKKSKQGFFVLPKLRKLDKSKFKIMRRLHLYEGKWAKSVDFTLVSNFGIFLIAAHQICGTLEKAEGREGNVNRFDGRTRFVTDHAEENLKDVKQAKAIAPLLKQVPIFSVVVYPDDAEIKVTGEGYVGNLKGMVPFIESCMTQENEISDETKQQLVKILKQANAKNTD